jgi:DNA-binding transcriptional regulator PaaX
MRLSINRTRGEDPDNYIEINKDLIRSFGIVQATLLVTLYNKHCNSDTDTIPFTLLECYNELGLNIQEQHEAFTSLINEGLVETIKKNKFSKRCFKITAQGILMIRFHQRKVCRETTTH